MLPNDIKEYINKHKNAGTAFEQVVGVLQDKGIDEAGINEAAKIWYGTGDQVDKEQGKEDKAPTPQEEQPKQAPQSQEQPQEQTQKQAQQQPQSQNPSANDTKPEKVESQANKEKLPPSDEKIDSKPDLAETKNVDSKNEQAAVKTNAPKKTSREVKMDKPAITVGLVGEVPSPKKPLATKPTENKQTDNKTQAPYIPPTPESLSSLEVAHDALPVKNLVRKLVPVLIILFLLTMLAAPFLIAYDIIPVDKNIKAAVSRLVLSIPFLPKNPEYVLGAVIRTHKNNPSGKIDLSIASSSADLKEVFETSNFDMSVVGGFDYSNIENKKLDLSATLGNNLSGNFRLINDKGYFKINELPNMLLEIMLAEDADLSEILDIWVLNNYAEFNSDARAFLDEKKSKKDKEYKEFANTVYDKYILPKIEMTSETVEGNAMYKLHLSMNQSEIIEVVNATKRISEPIPTKAVGPSVELVNVDLWIDKQTYYLKKAVISSVIGAQPVESSTETTTKVLGDTSISQTQNNEALLPALPSITNEKLDLMLVLNLTDVGSKLEVESPTEFITQEEFLSRLFNILEGSTGEELSYGQLKANMDIWDQAVDLYYEENSVYPEAVSDVGVLPQEGTVQIRTLANGSGIVLYLAVPDSAVPDQPYYTIVKLNGEVSSTGVYYSQAELEELTGSINLELQALENEPAQDQDSSPFGVI